jgi:hypothetical protein
MDIVRDVDGIKTIYSIEDGEIFTEEDFEDLVEQGIFDDHED